MSETSRRVAAPADNATTQNILGTETTRRTALKTAVGGAGLALAASDLHDAVAQDSTPAASPVAAATPIATPVDGSRPNILVILVDEMRDWQWFPDQEQRDRDFPALARLQQDAVVFGRHYTASNMCTPSRASLLTGLYSHQTGVVLTLGGNVATLTGQATPEGTEVPEQPILDPRFPTWGTMLRDQGYETYWFGKWHLNDESCDMEQYGFSGGTCPSPDGGPGEGQAQDPLIVDQAIDWLETQVTASDAPWCTTVSLVNPHDIQWYPRFTRTIPEQNDPPVVFADVPPTWEIPRERIAQHKPRLQLVSDLAAPQVFGVMLHANQPVWIEMEDLYYHLHRMLDTEIGRLLAALDAQPDVAANTVIVFTSDHGEYAGAHGLRGKGAAVYEEGIRIPFWVKDPTGTITADTDVPRTQLTSSVDVAPMLLTIASGGDAWREDPAYAHLATRADVVDILQDAEAPGREFVLHATDEDGLEYGPRLFSYLQDAPFHVLGLVADDAKLGVNVHWDTATGEILPDGQEIEFYDYTTEQGRLELENSASEDNAKFVALYQTLMTDLVPNELRAPLPEVLEAVRQEVFAKTLLRIEYDRATTQDDDTPNIATPIAG